MAYTINRWDGQAITTVEDGTVDQSLDIKLIGKNFAGYGEIQNENFLHMLENFARDQSPPNAIRGQVWFDTTAKKLKFYTGDQVAGQKVWKTAGGVEYGSTEPSNPTVGDLWFDVSRSQLKVRSSTTSWLTIGPQTAGAGVTQLLSQEVRGKVEGAPDSSAQSRAVIVAIVDDQPIYVISKEEFELVSQPTDEDGIVGFTKGTLIKPGLTLRGVNSQTGISNEGYVFWGTASNADRLNGLPASDYVRSTTAEFPTEVDFFDQGFTVGNTGSTSDPKLKISIRPVSNEPVVESVKGGNIIVRIENTDTVVFDAQSFRPASDSQFNLGTTNQKWNVVHANTFQGTAVRTNQLFVSSFAADPDGGFKTASVSTSPKSIVVRDGAGSISANIFSGIATSARYADLAENYLADAEYEVGTVVAVGGDKEITAADSGDRALGVVSGKPAYLMNSELQGGTAVALKGRVPVKVVGEVSKGDRLVADADGTAKVADTDTLHNVFAIALESSSESAVKIVECVVL